MSVPVTARLDPEVIDALDRAVQAGIAPTRGAVIATAVREWLQKHGEDAIVESYRRRYSEPDDDNEQSVARLGSFSVAACLAASER